MKRLAAVALPIAALLFAACGDSGEKNDYVNQVNEANSAQIKSITRITADATRLTAKPEQMADKLDQGADALEQTAGDLAAIDPPEGAAAGHKLLVSGTRKTAAEYRAAAKAARDGDVRAAAKALTTNAGGKQYEAGLALLAKDAGIKREN